MRKGADVNAANDTGRSALMLAPHQGIRPEDIRTLMDLGANPNAVDPTGATALHYALQDETYRDDVVKELLAGGANPTARDMCGRSALYLAAMHVSDNVLAFEALLNALPAAERGSHLAAALPAALKAKAEAIFDIIMEEEGIDVNVPDRAGWTALDVAHCYEMSREVETLEKRGATKGPPNEEPTAFSLFDRDCDISMMGGGLRARVTGILPRPLSYPCFLLLSPSRTVDCVFP